MRFHIDTGSHWTWVTNEDCPELMCPGDHYFYHNSVTYFNTRDVDEIHYMKGYVKGNIVTDCVSIGDSEDLQAHEVNFLSVFQAQDMDGNDYDGLLGLSPRTRTQLKGNSGHEMHLLVYELFRDDVIEKPVFSLYFTDNEEMSKFTVGGFDQKVIELAKKYNKDGKVANDSEDGIFWYQITTEDYWQVDL